MVIIGMIPPSFILKKTTLSLPDLKWAFDKGVVGARIVVDIAKSIKRAGEDSNVVAHLVSLTHAELPEARNMISMVAIDGAAAEESRHKWAWLVLSWLYEQHRDDADVLDNYGAG